MNQVPYFDTVFARVENPQEDFTIVYLNLLVEELPPITSPIDLIMEDINDNGFAIFDLTVNELIMFEGLNPERFYVHYFIAELDALNGINPIPFTTAFQNIQNPQTIFVHNEDTSTESCAVIIRSFQIIVEETPPIIQPIDLTAADDNGGGFAIFDLTENESIMLEGLNSSDYNVLYYENEMDAENGAYPIPESNRHRNSEDNGYPIADPTAYQNIENPQTIYVRV